MMARRVIAGRGGFSPKALFANGEQGVWYDPSDFSTMFQDAAGTTPVTAVEQPVGLMLDKSRGLVLGPELVTNGDFSNGTTGWSGFTAGLASATISNPGGFLRVTRTGVVAGWCQQVYTGFVVGKTYKVTVDFLTSNPSNLFISDTNNGVSTGPAALGYKTAAGTYTLYFTATYTTLYICLGTTIATADFDNVSVKLVSGNHAYQSTSANRPTLSARYNLFVGTETLATQNVPTVATTYTLRFEGTGSITLSGTKTGTYSAGTHSLTGVTAGTLTATVTGTVSKADLRVANDGVGLPPYQRVNTATDYDTVGFKPYLKFNGTNQWLQTNSIDLTYGDKMFVSAGVRKLSDAARGIVAEFGDGAVATCNFNLSAPVSATPGYAFRSIGPHGFDGYAEITSGYAAPITNILTGLSDISGDLAILRINGAQAASSTADQGTGNYGNYPLYIGARGGSSLYFNGHLYSLIVRGAQTPANLIAATERYVARKTGVTL